MAQGYIGHIGAFNSESEDWVSYTERLEHYFVANGIDDADKRRATLLSVCGPTTYQLIRDLLSPAKPSDKTFEELVALVKEHHQPVPSVIAQRYMFNTRTQQPGETVSAFVAQLRKIAQYCKFGDALDDMLRDRLVCGCRDRRLQYKLLADSELTFAKALSMAKANETADRGTKDLTGGSVNLLGSDRRRRPRPRPPPPKPGPKATQTPPPAPACYRCGASHPASTCKFKTSTCHYCKKLGHLASVCRKKARDLKSASGGRGDPRNHQLEVAAPDMPEDTEYTLYYAAARRPKPIEVSVTLSSVETTMEVDTGATLSVMSEETYNRLWARDARPPLLPSSAQLATYTGEKISAIGVIKVHVSYQQQQHHLQLLIVPGAGPSLLGRDWLQHIRLDWSRINRLHTSPKQHVDTVLAKYPAVFQDDLGDIKGAAATLHVDPSQQPRFYRARPVPYSLRPKVEAELTRLQDQGVISPVQFSDWAAPIVPVVKQDGNIRICGDYKLTINAVSKTDPYPLPRIEDIFASLSGGESFTKLDLAHAYQQIPLTDDSKRYTAINTHKGLFQYNRLPFGVASAPAVFQRTMDSILQALPHVCVYLDDILITGPTDEAHVKNATSSTTITALRSIFATHGIPELLVSDNGSVFTSAEFKCFTQQNGIRHATSAPYHPATNGLAERAVQTFKSFLKKTPGGTLEDQLSKFLFRYRITPHSTTGITPAELLLGRRPRSLLDLLRPSLSRHVRAQQEQQKRNRDQHTKPRTFSVGDSVYVCDLPSKDDWLPGTITHATGPLSFEVELSDGRTVRRHCDHLRPRVCNVPAPSAAGDWTCIPDPSPAQDPPQQSVPQPPPVVPPRRSGRVPVRPDRLVDHMYLSS